MTIDMPLPSRMHTVCEPALVHSREGEGVGTPSPYCKYSKVGITPGYGQEVPLPPGVPLPLESLPSSFTRLR